MPHSLANPYSARISQFVMMAQGETPMGVAMRHITDPVPSIRVHRPELAAEFENFFLRAMAKKPQERFSSARELMKVFDSLLPEERGPALSAEVRSSPETPNSTLEPVPKVITQPGSAGKGFGVGLLALLVLGVVAFFLFFAADDPSKRTLPSGQGNATPARFTRDGNMVTDNKTGLVWDASDNGSDITFDNAADYCRGARLPTTSELKTLYDGGIGIRSGEISVSACCVWASDPFTRRSLPAGREDEDPGDWAFAFGFGNSQDGKIGWNLRSYGRNLRALCVRE